MAVRRRLLPICDKYQGLISCLDKFMKCAQWLSGRVLEGLKQRQNIFMQVR